MKAYSNDLRQRVAAACAESSRNLPQVAAQFAVSLSFAEKLRRRQHTSGSIAALPHRGGPAPRLTEAGRATRWTWVAAQPDATLDELRQHLLLAGGPTLGRTTPYGVRYKRWTGGAKKKSLRRRARHRPGEGVTGAFVEAVQAEDFTRFKFVDETSINLTYTRRYGRRVDQAVPLHNGPNVTLIAALTT